MPMISVGDSLRFPSEARESLLEAAIRGRVALPYSCRTGRCGSCRCRLREGATEVLFDESGLSPEERATGWILSCARAATSDVALEVDEPCTLDLAAPRTLPCRITMLEALAADVLRVVLRLPPDSAFHWRAGQYVQVIGRDGIRRSYSIANADLGAQQLELHIRKVEGGAMSSWWFGAARSNDLLRLTGPHGTFVLRETSGRDLVFLATGTGIAPVKAMLEELAAGTGTAGSTAAAAPRSLRLYWGGRERPDLYWSPDVIGAGHRYTPVLSRADGDWQGARGHVQDVLLAEQPRLAQCDVYACGSEAMIRSARAALVGAGLAPGCFRSDAFVCSAVAQ